MSIHYTLCANWCCVCYSHPLLGLLNVQLLITKSGCIYHINVYLGRWRGEGPLTERVKFMRLVMCMLEAKQRLALHGESQRLEPMRLLKGTQNTVVLPS